MHIDSEGSGLLFDNSENKENNPNAPDFTGQANINGEQMRVAAWFKDFKGGEGLSLSIQPLDGNYSGGRSQEADEEDDEPAPRRSSGRSTGRASSGSTGRSSGRATASSGRSGGYKKPSRSR